MTHAAAASDSAKILFVPASNEDAATAAAAAAVTPASARGLSGVAVATYSLSTPLSSSSSDLALAFFLLLPPLPPLPSIPSLFLPLLHGQYDSAAVVSTASAQGLIITCPLYERCT
jgi:hypothetical protein